jgi:anthranilate phosphoribosyltransferase
VPIYAEALARLGSERSLIVAGDDGLDELSLAGGNEVAVVTATSFVMQRVTPADAGLASAPIEALRGGDAAYNAAALRRLLLGEKGAYRNAVVLNSAGALIAAGEAHEWREAAETAGEAIDNGLANALLNCWIEAAARR